MSVRLAPIDRLGAIGTQPQERVELFPMIEGQQQGIEDAQPVTTGVAFVHDPFFIDRGSRAISDRHSQTRAGSGNRRAWWESTSATTRDVEARNDSRVVARPRSAILAVSGQPDAVIRAGGEAGETGTSDFSVVWRCSR